MESIKILSVGREADSKKEPFECKIIKFLEEMAEVLRKPEIIKGKHLGKELLEQSKMLELATIPTFTQLNQVKDLLRIYDTEVTKFSDEEIKQYVSDKNFSFFYDILGRNYRNFEDLTFADLIEKMKEGTQRLSIGEGFGVSLFVGSGEEAAWLNFEIIKSNENVYAFGVQDNFGKSESVGNGSYWDSGFALMKQLNSKKYGKVFRGVSLDLPVKQELKSSNEWYVLDLDKSFGKLSVYEGVSDQNVEYGDYSRIIEYKGVQIEVYIQLASKDRKKRGKKVFVRGLQRLSISFKPVRETDNYGPENVDPEIEKTVRELAGKVKTEYESLEF